MVTSTLDTRACQALQMLRDGSFCHGQQLAEDLAQRPMHSAPQQEVFVHMPGLKTRDICEAELYGDYPTASPSCI